MVAILYATGCGKLPVPMLRVKAYPALKGRLFHPTGMNN
jgi:hypothetical protein